MRKNLRKHYFIDKPFQSRYATYVALILLIVCGVCFAGLYYSIWGSIIQSFSDENIFNEIKVAARIQDYEESRDPSEHDAKLSSLRLFNEINLLSARQREILDEILKRSNERLLPQVFLLILLIACGSIYLTHKIAGPLYRFRKSFEAVEKGDLTTRIYLRRNDEGMSVANSFNQMIRVLDESVSSLKKTVRESDPNTVKGKIEEELSKLKTSDH